MSDSIKQINERLMNELSTEVTLLDKAGAVLVKVKNSDESELPVRSAGCGRYQPAIKSKVRFEWCIRHDRLPL